MPFSATETAPTYRWRSALRGSSTRAFAQRYMARMKRIPTSYQAGMYSATLHYLRAIEALGTDEAGKVLAKM